MRKVGDVLMEEKLEREETSPGRGHKPKNAGCLQKLEARKWILRLEFPEGTGFADNWT